MSVVRREARRRWALVGTAVAVVCLLPVAIAALPGPSARAEPARLRELILASADQPYHGFADTQGGIGLPVLPAVAELVGPLGGSMRMRAWYASPQAWRVAVLTATGETDTYRTVAGTYVWDFERNLLTQTVREPALRLPRAADLLPPDLARRLLAAGADTDQLAAIPSQRVAGVAAAGLRLTPSDPDTSFGRVDVWADPDTGLPLRVEVAGRGGATAFRSRFLELAQQAPGADLLVPSQPDSAGYTVTTGEDVVAAVNDVAFTALPATLDGRPRRVTPAGTPEVIGLGAYGTGLSAFVAVALPHRVGHESMDAARAGGGVPVTVGDGEAYEMQTSLLSALIVNSPGGRGNHQAYLLVGSVTPELLRRAGAELLALLPEQLPEQP